MKNKHLRFYILKLTKLGLGPTAIHEELTTAWGLKVLSSSTVQKWAKLFRDGRMEVEDDPRSRRPVTRVTEENIDLVRQIIDDDPHSTYDNIEEETLLCQGTIFKILHDHLKVMKISSS